VTVQNSDQGLVLGPKRWSLREWINATQRQQEFLDAFVPLDWSTAYQYPGYGGAAGGGKSYIIRKGLLLFLLRAHARWGIKNCRVGLFCEDYPSLTDRQISKIKEEFPRHLGELKSSRDLGEVFLLREQFGGGFIALRNLDDPSKYDSTEFAGIAVDEFTKNKKLMNLFDQLRKRLRWPIQVQEGGTFPDGFKFPLAWGSNPGGPGHGDVKKLWIDRDFPEHLQREAHEFKYIPARVSDNPYVSPGYIRTLESLPPDLRAAYLDGSWDSFAGQYFGEWREAYHVVPAFEVPKFWKRIICVDWGWSNPFCCLFLAVNSDGDVYVYREFYGTERLPEWWAERIIEACELDGIQVGDYTKVIDPAAFNHEPRFGRPVADMFQDAGLAFMRANNDRLNGWMQVHSFMMWERYQADTSMRIDTLKRRPKLALLKGAAPNLQRTLPNLVKDENRPEDVDTDGEDHAPDTLRYGLMTCPRPTRIPIDQLTEEWREVLARAAVRERERAR
jgi:phage terminase large subunit